MRYEARDKFVYDREEDTVVEACGTPTEAQTAARKANEQDQEWRDIESLMRSNRSLCG